MRFLGHGHEYHRPWPVSELVGDVLLTHCYQTPRPVYICTRLVTGEEGGKAREEGCGIEYGICLGWLPAWLPACPAFGGW